MLDTRWIRTGFIDFIAFSRLRMLRLLTLGQSAATVRDRTLSPGAELLFAGVVVLGLDSGRQFAREDLAEFLWPDADHVRRGARFRWLLNRFRSLGLPLESTATHVWLRAKAVSADYLAVSEMELEAIGPILPGYRPDFSAPFARWLDDKREVIATEVLRQLLPMLTSATRADDWALATRIASAIQRVDPLNEEAVLTLAEARCRLGAKAQALAGLDAYLDALGDDRAELQLPAKVLQRRLRNADEGSSLRSDTRFLDRTEPLRRITTLLTAARDGTGGAAMITGPAGIGKSRVLAEAIERTSVSRTQMVRVQCQPGDRARPLSGLVDLIPKLLSLRGAAGSSPASVERLSQLVDAEREMPGDEQASPEVLRSQLCAAVLDVLDAASAELPVTVIVDDVQWADRSLTWLWERIVSWSASHPVAFLFGFRSSAHDEPQLDVPRIALASLELPDATKLLDDLLSGVSRDAPDTVRTMLLARGAGRPLFLREIVRHWALTGGTDALPTSLAGLFDAGLASLSAPALRALEVAAILESQATLERMEHIMELTRGAFVDAIVELETAGILSADAKGNVFGHVLWAEAVSRRMSDSTARVLHRHAAARFDTELLENPSSTLLWQTARHWERAGLPERAEGALIHGAEHLVQHGFPGEAAQIYGHLAAQASDDVKRLPLMRRQIDLLLLAGRLTDLSTEIEKHEALASRLNPSYDRHNELEMMQLLVRYAGHGDLEGAMRWGLSCARERTATAAHRLSAAKEAARIGGLCAPAVLEELVAIVAEIRPRTRDERRNHDRVHFEYHLALGAQHTAVEIAERSLADQRAGENRRHVTIGLHLCAEAYTLVGRFGDTREMFLEAIELSKQYGLLTSLTTAYDALIGLSLDLDPPHVTRALIEDVRKPVAMIQSYGGVAHSSLFVNHEAQLAVLEARPEDALRLVKPLDESLASTVPRWRARFLAIHLAARTAVDDSNRIDEIASQLGQCFDSPDHWMDWPATVYAAHVERTVDRRAAVDFARRYVDDVRRERFPAPQRLRDLCAAEAIVSST